MTQYRLAATTGGTLTAQGVADIRNRTAQLIRGLDYIQQLIDQELRRFRVGVAKTSEDTEKMDGFAKALRGDK